MAELACWQVDAFTEEPFGGNPAAVVLLEHDPPEAWMQAVGAEMNLSETAFVRSRPDGEYGLRWFTPAAEVALCGHATLASAHMLWESGALAAGRAAVFHTKSGRLAASRNGVWIEMDFPALPVEEAPAPSGLLDALGAKARFVGKTRMDCLVELESEAAVRSLTPDFARLAAAEARGIIVTARSEREGADFVSRFFAPAVGIAEDPVTGSAHCALAPYWQARLGRAAMVGRQVSARGGIVRVEVRGDRVALGGRAVTVLRGTLVGLASAGAGAVAEASASVPASAATAKA
ncbi:MAG TPA: PhzF family phenazine biosynthesis protein [Candidatus Eisenbacteria bacterium]